MTHLPSLAAVVLAAGLCGLIAIWLMLHVGAMRGKLSISIGDGGNPAMIRAMRRQANFVETVPLTLVLMVLLALTGWSGLLLYAIGALLVLGRLLHALHFTRAEAPGWQRSVGSSLSLLATLAASLLLLGTWLGMMT
ncbi:glutathione S-transferase [Paroceanicella profunda]|uniref:Glutathione S-transferase n=1 Tax=Paroceanicella profunda TaxID=2579971 RepID=A0A5B8FGA0_9RHOB|nr:MAPEG family protein [Paroceanicella profunda]QDL90931.1 glutathione S-transferase [Paroceanicella profunda]